jgi:hypothetical protein
MTETEVFRISPEYGKFYEHAEYTRQVGRYPNEKYYTNILPRYVGRFVQRVQGGWGDGSWRRDYFLNEIGLNVAVDYSYEGRTSFREVLPRMRPELKDAIHNKKRNPSLMQIVISQLSTLDLEIMRNNTYFEYMRPGKL